MINDELLTRELRSTPEEEVFRPLEYTFWSGWNRFKIPNRKKHTKCYSARTGLKRMNNDIGTTIIPMSQCYNGCKHCAWYSYVFYNKSDGVIKIIENNYDFEQVKKQFVNHMNRSHKDICKKKHMQYLKDREKYV